MLLLLLLPVGTLALVMLLLLLLRGCLTFDFMWPSRLCGRRWYFEYWTGCPEGIPLLVASDRGDTVEDGQFRGARRRLLLLEDEYEFALRMELVSVDLQSPLKQPEVRLGLVNGKHGGGCLWW